MRELSQEPDQAIRLAFSGRLGGFTLAAAFEVPMRGVTALFGPSGCGKTTILRAIAGLHRLEGHFSIAGDVWQDDREGRFLRPHKRPIGYVFQEASLFPHLSVRGNLRYGLRRAHRDSDGQHAIKEDDIVEMLGIGHLLERFPEGLSGGERQRVALGRALLTRPRLLLMDEPLSALDRLTKEEILPYFERLHERMSIPMIYVSHDIGEVERLADRLVLLKAGSVLACGPLAELEADPALPLIRAPDAAVTLEGRIAARDEVYALTSIEVPGGTLAVSGLHGEAGCIRRLRVKASDVSFCLRPPAETTILNVMPARIVSIAAYDRDAAQIDVVAALGAGGGGARIVGRITRKSLDSLGLEPGKAVYAQIKGAALIASGGGGIKPNRPKSP
jgi:molybdate transport system ATP-binding protein